MKEFFKKHKNSAIKACKGTGLFPSVMLAQAALESGYGRSELSTKYNNYFGIKAHNYKGATVNMSTGEVVNGNKITVNSNFRVYSSVTQSFKDRNNFLKENQRYKEVFKKNTPEEQSYELQRAGYATAENYAETIIKIINENQLKKIDNQMELKIKLEILFLVLIVVLVVLNFQKIKNYSK